jgi:putative endonuclease
MRDLAETANTPAPTAGRNGDPLAIRASLIPPFEGPAQASELPAAAFMAEDKRFVYVLRNANEDPHYYVGLTSDVDARLTDHNTGRCPHTAIRRPWQRHVVIEFPDEHRAIRFERYLKSGSGRAFAKRHFER